MAVRRLARACFVALVVVLGVQGTNVQITTTTRQTTHGVGASGAWWVNDLALYPEDVRQNVSNLLLDQTNGGVTTVFNLVAHLLSFVVCMQVLVSLTTDTISAEAGLA